MATQQPAVTEPKKDKANFVKINQIKPGEHCYFVYVKVTKVTKNDIIERRNGEQRKEFEGEVGDETGVINARLVGDYGFELKEGKVYCIRNGRSEVFEEHHRLEIDQWGQITQESDDLINTINASNRLSDAKYAIRLVPRNSGEGNRKRNDFNRDRRNDSSRRGQRDGDDNGQRGGRRQQGGQRRNDGDGGNRQQNDGGNRRYNNNNNEGGNRRYNNNNSNNSNNDGGDGNRRQNDDGSYKGGRSRRRRQQQNNKPQQDQQQSQ